MPSQTQSDIIATLSSCALSDIDAVLTPGECNVMLAFVDDAARNLSDLEALRARQEVDVPEGFVLWADPDHIAAAMSSPDPMIHAYVRKLPVSGDRLQPFVLQVSDDRSAEVVSMTYKELDSLIDELDSLRIALKESEAGELRNALAVGRAVLELQEDRKELDRLRAANEDLTMRLAGCGVIAGCNTTESLESALDGIHADYLSASLESVAAAVRREISLRAANARLQAWHDAVVAARVVDAVDVGTAAMVLRQANGRILELQDAVDEIERRSVKAIIRPQPLANE